MKKRIFENPLMKDRIMLVESSNESGGAHTLIEMELQPGSGNHLHYHKYITERLTAIRGELWVEIGRNRIRLQPGESITAPADVVHRFYNPGSRSVIFRIKLTPGHEMFEKSLVIVYGLAADGRVHKNGIPKNLDHLALLMSMTDTGIPGILSFIQPYMKWRGKKAIARGMHHHLLKKYCK